jgi:competence protein ComEA
MHELVFMLLILISLYPIFAAEPLCLIRMSLKKILKDLLTLSSREYTGTLVLMVLIVLVMLLNLFLRSNPVTRKGERDDKFKRELENFSHSLTRATMYESSEEGPAPVNLFPFDPNTATLEEFENLGVDEKLAGRILNYRDKGGRFTTKEDIRKIYGFSPVLYANLAPYIIIVHPSIQKDHVPTYLKKPDTAICSLELNTCDSSGLEQLRGIGPVLARRIIRYRDLLGGFYTVEQLREVYGISDSLFQKIRGYFYTDPDLVHKIAINDAGEAQLSRHPYIGRYTAKAIISYRKATGRISDMDELIQNKILPEGIPLRLRPYLIFP